ncbi:uncharacterized protein LOC121323951 [Polyodon spathula]|uniref:uncharacterized protein LOC121323951 n=1 Tax=Polyodon spathula TaxID=7913 RepID=UPI001B7EAA48|nr:uncharacterized protein LOC121323951 [Polyodon spathula]
MDSWRTRYGPQSKGTKDLEESLADLQLDDEDEKETYKSETFETIHVLDSGLLLSKGTYDRLYEYQKQGLAFLYSLHQPEKKGGILADDMGLGKTVQIVTFLSGMLEMDLIRSVLLVMPCSLLGNWVTEFKTWTPSISFKVFHHSERNPDKNLNDVQTIGDVLITSYETLAQNWQKFSKHNEIAFTWDIVIFDEAHKIKTPTTKSFKAACLIPAHTRILLTGTPIQNNLKEMWALFNVACQETLLGTYRTFKKLYEDPISKAREKNASPHMKSLGLKMSESLREMITPYYLRRTKEEVQKNRHDSDHRNERRPENKENHDPKVAVEMPLFTRKNDFVIWLHLSPLQEILYKKLIYSNKVKECLETSRSPLSDLNTLKKICAHPRLLSAQVYRELFHLDKSGIDCWNGDEDMWGADVSQQSSETLIQQSGKLLFLVSLLEKLREEGNRTLVFSQSRKMLDIIENILDERGFKVMRVDGTVSHLAQRERQITTFKKNRDYSVFLLTTQVGGLGLNLTAANRVVIFDPCWNPATDDQAVDRVYRIGQKKAVVIYRLITCGTVEEKIYRRQVFKNSLIRQASGDEKNPVRYFNNQELKELFILEDTQSSSTQIQLQKTHAAQRQTDKELDAHIAYLHSLKIFGISDHNLLFSETQEDENETEAAQNYIRLKVEKAQGLIEAESQVVRHHNMHEADMKLSKPQKKSPKNTWDERDTGMSSPEGLGQSKGSSEMEDDSYNASDENAHLTEERECLQGGALQNNSNTLPEKEATKTTWDERGTDPDQRQESFGMENDLYNANDKRSLLREGSELEWHSVGSASNGTPDYISQSSEMNTASYNPGILNSVFCDGNEIAVTSFTENTLSRDTGTTDVNNGKCKGMSDVMEVFEDPTERDSLAIPNHCNSLLTPDSKSIYMESFFHFKIGSSDIVTSTPGPFTKNKMFRDHLARTSVYIGNMEGIKGIFTNSEDTKGKGHLLPTLCDYSQTDKTCISSAFVFEPHAIGSTPQTFLDRLSGFYVPSESDWDENEIFISAASSPATRSVLLSGFQLILDDSQEDLQDCVMGIQKQSLQHVLDSSKGLQEAQDGICLTVEKAQEMTETESQVIRHYDIHETDMKLSKPKKKSPKNTWDERDMGMSSTEVLGLSKGGCKMEDDSYNARDENYHLTEESEGGCLQGVALQSHSNALPEKEATKTTWDERDTGMSSTKVPDQGQESSEMENDSYNVSDKSSPLMGGSDCEWHSVGSSFHRTLDNMSQSSEKDSFSNTNTASYNTWLLNAGPCYRTENAVSAFAEHRCKSRDTGLNNGKSKGVTVMNVFEDPTEKESLAIPILCNSSLTPENKSIYMESISHSNIRSPDIVPSTPGPFTENRMFRDHLAQTSIYSGNMEGKGIFKNSEDTKDRGCLLPMLCDYSLTRGSKSIKVECLSTSNIESLHVLQGIEPAVSPHAENRAVIENKTQLTEMETFSSIYMDSHAEAYLPLPQGKLLENPGREMVVSSFAENKAVKENETQSFQIECFSSSNMESPDSMQSIAILEGKLFDDTENELLLTKNTAVIENKNKSINMVCFPTSNTDPSDSAVVLPVLEIDDTGSELSVSATNSPVSRSLLLNDLQLILDDSQEHPQDSVMGIENESLQHVLDSSNKFKEAPREKEGTTPTTDLQSFIGTSRPPQIQGSVEDVQKHECGIQKITENIIETETTTCFSNISETEIYNSMLVIRDARKSSSYLTFTERWTNDFPLYRGFMKESAATANPCIGDTSRSATPETSLISVNNSLEDISHSGDSRNHLRHNLVTYLTMESPVGIVKAEEDEGWDPIQLPSNGVIRKRPEEIPEDSCLEAASNYMQAKEIGQDLKDKSPYINQESDNRSAGISPILKILMKLWSGK